MNAYLKTRGTRVSLDDLEKYTKILHQRKGI
jgi:hypothetical protein